LGFTASACGAWAGVGKNRKNRFFFVDWPRDWLEFYEANRFYEHDTLVIEARRRVSPFLCSEIALDTKLTQMQKRLHDAAIAYGWREVFAIPVHGPGSLQGLVTLAMREVVTLSVVDRAILRAMGLAIFERCRASTEFGIFNPAPVPLSGREVECLQWAAAGKSDTQIAKMVGVKPVTVHFHIEQAKRKLRAKSRTEAVATGVLNGII
jgi:DNA-binding CsgD family transcriptional regulator